MKSFVLSLFILAVAVSQVSCFSLFSWGGDTDIKKAGRSMALSAHRQNEKEKAEREKAASTKKIADPKPAPGTQIQVDGTNKEIKLLVKPEQQSGGVQPQSTGQQSATETIANVDTSPSLTPTDPEKNTADEEDDETGNNNTDANGKKKMSAAKKWMIGIFITLGSIIVVILGFIIFKTIRSKQ